MVIVAVDDKPENVELIGRLLSDYDVKQFTSATDALEYCTTHPFDLLVSDQRMPVMTGTDLVRAIREHRNDFLAIIVSAYTDSEYLIDAVNSNLIHKYILKPLDADTFRQYVRRALERVELVRSNRRLTAELEKRNALLEQELDRIRRVQAVHEDFFTSREPVMHLLREQARMCAASDQPVLIVGETGSGKELLARAIHDLSSRSSGPFVAVNCSAFAESLFESELFGHEKGAFTDARQPRDGFLQAADGGTLFFDEVGDLSPALQGKLLRVLQFGTYHRVGSTTERTVNLRVVSATNTDLTQPSHRARFRSDLYFRLNTFVLQVPPLRERPQDTTGIMQRIAVRRGLRIPPIAPDAERMLCAYSYPGNVRELESIVEQLCAYASMVDAEVIDAPSLQRIVHNDLCGAPHGCADRTESLPASGAMSGLTDPLGGGLNGGSLSDYLDAVRRAAILQAFDASGRNISRTARRLGISRQGLKNALARYQDG